MNRRCIIGTMLAGILAATLAACGGSHQQAQPAAITATRAAVASPTPSPTPTVMTTKQAGARYLALVGPANKQVTRINQLWPEGQVLRSKNFPALKKAYSAYADAAVVQLRGFTAPGWPSSVQKELGEMAIDVGALQSTYREAAQAKTRAELETIWQDAPTQKYPSAAEIVRAKLGLPEVPA